MTDMPYERLRPVLWRGELVALAGEHRFHIISPRLCTEDPPRDEVKYVALLCLYHRQGLTGELPDTADPRVAEHWADTMVRLSREH